MANKKVARGKTEFRYAVKDARTGYVVGKYVTRDRAMRQADKLDLTYGAVRYVVTFL